MNLKHLINFYLLLNFFQFLLSINLIIRKYYLFIKKPIVKYHFHLNQLIFLLNYYNFQFLNINQNIEYVNLFYLLKLSLII